MHIICVTVRWFWANRICIALQRDVIVNDSEKSDRNLANYFKIKVIENWQSKHTCQLLANGCHCNLAMYSTKKTSLTLKLAWHRFTQPVQPPANNHSSFQLWILVSSRWIQVRRMHHSLYTHSSNPTRLFCTESWMLLCVGLDWLDWNTVPRVPTANWLLAALLCYYWHKKWIYNGFLLEIYDWIYAILEIGDRMEMLFYLNLENVPIAVLFHII